MLVGESMLVDGFTWSCTLLGPRGPEGNDTIASSDKLLGFKFEPCPNNSSMEAGTRGNRKLENVSEAFLKCLDVVGPVVGLRCVLL